MAGVGGGLAQVYQMDPKTEGFLLSSLPLNSRLDSRSTKLLPDDRFLFQDPTFELVIMSQESFILHILENSWPVVLQKAPWSGFMCRFAEIQVMHFGQDDHRSDVVFSSVHRTRGSCRPCVSESPG